MQVKLKKISYIWTLFKVQFIQDSGLFIIRFGQVSMYNGCKEHGKSLLISIS